MTERNDSELSEGEKEDSQIVLTGSLLYIKEISQIFCFCFLFFFLVLIGSLLYVKEGSQVVLTGSLLYVKEVSDFFDW